MGDLISVIIPVYNTEKYLEKCLISVQRQTYDNLEVILIDDGSTDRSAAICDIFAENDKRFKVIHQENAGQAGARNVGLKKAAGKYIGFVDSDDYIEPEMFEEMYRETQNSGAYIVMCRFKRFGKIDGGFIPLMEEADREKAVKLLVEDKIICSHLWDKLFLRVLFDGIEFPEGKAYEDIAVMHLLFLKTNKIKIINKIFYHYQIRENSTVTTVSEKNIRERNEAYGKRCNDLKDTPFYGSARTTQVRNVRMGMGRMLLKGENKTDFYRENKLKIKQILADEKKLIDKKEVYRAELLLRFPYIYRLLKRMKIAVIPDVWYMIQKDSSKML